MLRSEIVKKLYDILVEYLNSRSDFVGCEINSFKIEEACDAGDNFLGAIYALTASVSIKDEGSGAGKGKRNEEINLIAKSQVFDNNEDVATSAQKYFWNVLFMKERMMYTDLISEMESVGNVKLAPKFHYYYSEDEEYACILLENLITSGYYIPDFQSLTFAECGRVMENLSTFHALSLVVEGKSGAGILDKFDFVGCELFFSPMMEHVMKPYVQNSYRGVLEICEKFRPDLVEPLKKFNDEKSLWDRGCDHVRPGKTCFSSVCHGDARLKNMFLISPQLQTKETATTTSPPSSSAFRFIDFQITRYASPVTDLIYFLYLSTSAPFRQAYTKHLLKIYHSNFTSILNAFPNVPVNKEAKSWTLDKLFQEYNSLADYALVVTIAITPTIYLRPEDIGEALSSKATREEKQNFLIQNRAQVIADVANRNHVLRSRILDAVDEILVLKPILASEN